MGDPRASMPDALRSAVERARERDRVRYFNVSRGTVMHG